MKQQRGPRYNEPTTTSTVALPRALWRRAKMAAFQSDLKLAALVRLALEAYLPAEIPAPKPRKAQEATR